jgi:sulfur-oxidizing protein SoxB
MPTLRFRPAFAGAPALPPDTDITAEDVWAQTAITYPAAYRSVMKGAAIKALLEDIADNLVSPRSLLPAGRGYGERSGGITFTLDVAAAAGQRISDIRG